MASVPSPQAGSLSPSPCPTPADVKKCDPSSKTPHPPRNVPPRRCLRRDQLPDDGDPLRRHPDTSWILCSDGPTAPDHFVTTHQVFFTPPQRCRESGACRGRLLWRFLLHKHAQRVAFETHLQPPEIEPYVTEYSGTFCDPEFKPALEVSLADAEAPEGDIDVADSRYPLYSDPAASYWYQKQKLPERPRCWDRVSPQADRLLPFRRNALFTTPICQTLHDPPNEAPFIKEPRHKPLVDLNINAPVDTPVPVPR